MRNGNCPPEVNNTKLCVSRCNNCADDDNKYCRNVDTNNVKFVLYLLIDGHC